MANLITRITAEIIEQRGSKKGFPCKTFATQAAADVAGAAMAEMVREHFAPASQRECDFISFRVDAWDRWVVVIFQSEVMQRPGSQGGYICIATSKGFLAV